MSDADKAFDVARVEIQRVAEAGETSLDFDKPEYRALNRLPEEIAGLTALQTLYLHNTQAADISYIAGLTALQTLSLSDTQVADISYIAGLTALQRLYLSNTPVADIAHIAGLTALQTLYLRNTQVADISHIAGLTALQTLSLSDTQVAEISHIAGLTALQRLILNNTQVADISYTARLTALQWLALAKTQVADLRPLADLPQLGEGNRSGLWFDDTPAVKADPELADLAKVENDKQRTKDTQAYLRSLPTWPEPLPWLPQPQQRGVQGASIETPDRQIAAILAHAARHQVQANVTAADLRRAVQQSIGFANDKPQVILMVEDMATILERLPQSIDGGENDLRQRIAELEAKVRDLSKLLEDSDARAEAAEALAKSNEAADATDGFWLEFRKTHGTKMGELPYFFVKSGTITYLISLLGPNHPFAVILMKALGL